MMNPHNVYINYGITKHVETLLDTLTFTRIHQILYKLKLENIPAHVTYGTVKKSLTYQF